MEGQALLPALSSGRWSPLSAAAVAAADTARYRVALNFCEWILGYVALPHMSLPHNWSWKSSRSLSWWKGNPPDSAEGSMQPGVDCWENRSWNAHGGTMGF